jgi:hypothetical protein
MVIRVIDSCMVLLSAHETDCAATPMRNTFMFIELLNDIFPLFIILIIVYYQCCETILEYFFRPWVSCMDSSHLIYT